MRPAVEANGHEHHDPAPTPSRLDASRHPSGSQNQDQENPATGRVDGRPGARLVLDRETKSDEPDDRHAGEQRHRDHHQSATRDPILFDRAALNPLQAERGEQGDRKCSEDDELDGKADESKRGQQCFQPVEDTAVPAQGEHQTTDSDRREEPDGAATNKAGPDDRQCQHSDAQIVGGGPLLLILAMLKINW